MTDFSKMVSGKPAAVNADLEAFEFKPEGLTNAKGEPLALELHPQGSTMFIRAARKLHMRGKIEVVSEEDALNLTEEEMDAKIDKDDAGTAELVARCCTGWNLVDKDGPVELTIDMAIGFFEYDRDLCAEAFEAMAARGKKPKATKPA